MIDTTDPHRVTFIVLRFMRKPILALVAVYATSMVGWVLIPGVNEAGEPEALSFFHAFYFLTYTATTTGFGEIPYTFSEAQRMWSIVSLYAGVVAWLYAVGSIIHLLRNPHFTQAVAERRFARVVARIREPFVILCGFGSTGSLLTRGLSDAGVTAVILDTDPDRINAFNLRDYRVTMYALCADVRSPSVLVEAGLLRANCKAVVALTREEEVNLKVSVTARLLNPKVQVITQSTSAIHEETLSTLGGDVHIIDPFQTYAKYLGGAIHTPAIRMLSEWLAGAPGSQLETLPRLPKGTWILCGYGRMGRRIRESLEALQISTVVIEPEVREGDEQAENIITGRANQATLRAAGIDQAAGIVAGTNNDAYNLSISLNAKALNPGIFLIVRQNHHLNEALFSAASADLIMQPSLVGARRILFLLTAPLLKTFYDHLRTYQLESDERLLGDVVRDLRQVVGGTRPRLWTVDICEDTASALLRFVAHGGAVTLSDIVRDPSNRDDRLACVPLVVKSGDDVSVMPDSSRVIKPDDQILFCGTNRAHHLLAATLHNDYTLRYLVTGLDEPRSVIIRWVMGRHSTRRTLRHG